MPTTPDRPVTCTGVVDAVGRPVAELAFGVFAPAPHRAVAQHGAGVGAPAADGGGAGDAGHRHGRGRIRIGPVAQLRVAVSSPASHRAVPHHRAGVIRAGRKRGDAADAADRHRLGSTGIGGGPVAELPVDVLAPAAHRAVREKRAGVSVSGREVDGAGEPVHRHGREREGAEAFRRRAAPTRPAPSTSRCRSTAARTRTRGRRRQRVAVVMPLTGTSTGKSVQLPSPSCPNWFRPVHCAVPSGSRTHVYSPPADTAPAVIAPLAVNCCA